jgi:hypothetical protein
MTEGHGKYFIDINIENYVENYVFDLFREDILTGPVTKTNLPFEKRDITLFHADYNSKIYIF